MAHQWEGPDIVHRWLETGDEGLREPAEKALNGVAFRSPRVEVYNAFRAALFASGACRVPVHEAAQSANLYSGATDANAAHLRTLVLRRALPERLWPLIDRVAIDGDERVLCDALLQGRGG